MEDDLYRAIETFFIKFFKAPPDFCGPYKKWNSHKNSHLEAQSLTASKDS